MSIRKRAGASVVSRLHDPLNRKRNPSLVVESGSCIDEDAHSKSMVKRSLRGSITEGFKKLRTALKPNTDESNESVPQNTSKGKEPVRENTSSSDSEMTCFCDSPRAAIVEGRSIICDCANGQALSWRRAREWDEGEGMWARPSWMIYVNSQHVASAQIPMLGFEAKDLPLAGRIAVEPAEGEAGPSNWHGRPKSTSESGVSLYVDDESVASEVSATPSTGANSEASGVTCFRCNSAKKDESHPAIAKQRSWSAPSVLASMPMKRVLGNRPEFLRRQSLFAATSTSSKEVVGAPCESSKQTRMLKSPVKRVDTVVDDWNIEGAAENAEEHVQEETGKLLRQLALFDLRPAPTPSSSPVSNPLEDIISPLTSLSPAMSESFPSYDENIASGQMAAYDSHRPSHATSSDPLIETAEKLRNVAGDTVKEGSG